MYNIKHQPSVNNDVQTINPPDSKDVQTMGPVCLILRSQYFMTSHSFALNRAHISSIGEVGNVMKAVRNLAL